jgi:hypothetical protein
MARLLIHVEGQTEQTFVNEILRDHMVAKGYHSVEARNVGNARQRGGICKWPLARKGIMNHLKEDLGCIATTMVDYYALPQNNPDGWPGRSLAADLGTAEEKGQCVQNALQNDLVSEMGNRFDASRFVPFVIMHEFEGLLFSDCTAFSRGIYHPDIQPAFSAIREQFTTPEEIDDSPDTAPSRRMQALVPGYQKPLLGVLAVMEIGLAAIRAECPHFDGWLKALESRVH